MAKNTKITDVLKSKAQEASGSPDIGNSIYDRMIADIRSQAEREANEQAQIKIQAAETRCRAAEVERDAANNEKASAQRQTQELQSQIGRYRSESESRTTERDELKKNYDAECMKCMKLEAELSEAKIIAEQNELRGTDVNKVLAHINTMKNNSNDKTIPSFEFTPNRDSNNKLLSVTAKPIGAN